MKMMLQKKLHIKRLRAGIEMERLRQKKRKEKLLIKSKVAIENVIVGYM